MSILRQNRGTAAIELALISPMLLILLAGIIDFGRVYREEIELSAAVAAAAQYALVNAASINSTNAASLATTLTGIVANTNGPSWASASVTVNNGPANANNCWCPTGASTTWGWGSAATCGSTCAGGTLAGKFVMITGTRSFSAIFTSYGLIGNTTLNQSAIVQAQ